MGQKINPVGFRVGISKDWSSKWFYDKSEYSKYAIEDHKIRRYLEKKFDLAGLKDVLIERSGNILNLTIRVSNPGVVIGKGGSGVESAEKDIKKITKSVVKITAEEVKGPEIQANIVANNIYKQLKKRAKLQKVVQQAIRAAMDKGAKGIKVKVSGLLGGGSSIARTETYKEGSIPVQRLRADIDYAQVHAHMLYGAIGIKVWIYKGDLEL
jgi:small subunit ribosomal protein S3